MFLTMKSNEIMAASIEITLTLHSLLCYHNFMITEVIAVLRFPTERYEVMSIIQR